MPLPTLPTFHPPLALGTFEVVLVLLFVVGGVVKNFFDKAVGPGGNRPTTTTPPLVPPRPAATPISEEERARRLMEALGLPVSAPPPLPVRPPVAVPPPLPPNIVVPRRTAPPSLPPVTEPPTATARRPRPAQNLDTSPRRGRAGAEPAGQNVRPPAAATANLRGLLRTTSRAELRRAILLREVLGPPRALSEVGTAD